MARTEHRLAFEEPIYELEAQVNQLEALPEKSIETHEEIRRLRRDVADLKKKVFSTLEPWERVEVARHPDRPMLTDYLDLVFDEFVELHGDKFFGDDRALRSGFAKLDRFKVMVIGHHKGKTLKERNACYFGCAHPEGYRKAMSKMELAAKYGMPIIAFIDTPGAFPGIGAEERGQAQVIAESMMMMSRLPVPKPTQEQIKTIAALSRRLAKSGLTELSEDYTALNALAARLYSISADEYAHILDTFPLIPEPTRTACLSAFRS